MSKKKDFEDGEFVPASSFRFPEHDFVMPYARERSDNASISNWEPSLTAQEFAEECDINVIMQRHPDIGAYNRSLREPIYADFTSVPNNLQEAMEQVRVASNAFYELPAQVRREFDNDPVRFADFASDPDNVDQLRDWGLAKPKAVDPEPMRVHVVSTAPEEPAGRAPSASGGSAPGSAASSSGASPPSPKAP